MERIGQTIEDKRGTIRTLYRDGLGRQTNDCVTTNGSGTDVTVKQIITAYEVRGMVATVTSTDSASQGAGTVLNQVQLTYNTFAQLTQEEQSHSGAVGSAPSVYYYYDTGASGSNEIRLNQLRYPNSRVLTYNFASGMDATLNPVTSISDTSTTLASYTYLGLGTVVRIAYPQPSVWLDLWGGTSGVFNGLDLFNRIIDQRWQNNTGGTPVDIDRYQYGYSYNSNRLWKANVVGTMNVSAGLDELYQYDSINRLTEMQRGVLNSSHNGFTGTIAREMDYTLDATGNWPTYLTKTNGTTDLNQGRVSNTVNEITSITESGSTPLWVTPLYDDAGNMTTMPQPGTPTGSFTATYDAWNRMTEVDSGGSPVGQYQYDGRNRRIVAVTSDTRHFYFTNDWQDIEQRLGSSTSMDQQYVWGIRYIDELVCRDDATYGRSYATQDANYNLTAIADTGGTPQEYYFYDPYGAPTILNSSWSVISVSAYTWTIGHQGLFHDHENGLIYNRVRMIHSALGGFTARDPLGYVDGAALYQYEGGNPLVGLDPLGLNIWGILNKLPIFGTIYDATVTNPGTSPGAYSGWDSINAWNDECKCGKAAAELKCAQRIWWQLVPMVAGMAGIPLVKDTVGDIAGLVAAIALAKGGKIAVSASGGITVILGVDAAADLAAIISTAVQMGAAAKAATKSQCRCRADFQ